jgi:hypothetical protein
MAQLGGNGWVLARPVQCMASPGALVSVSATKGSTSAGGRRRNLPLSPGYPRRPDMFLPAVEVRYNRCQSLAVGGTHVNADPLAHAGLKT